MQVKVYATVLPTDPDDKQQLSFRIDIEPSLKSCFTLQPDKLLLLIKDQKETEKKHILNSQDSYYYQNITNLINTSTQKIIRSDILPPHHIAEHIA